MMDKVLFKTINECRICGSDKIKVFLELGLQPPANSLRCQPHELLPEIPLSICRCPRCTTVQLTETVSPEYLFKNYVWVTGTSATTLNYSLLFYRESRERCAKHPLFVVEVASNDGTFLTPFKNNGHRVLGIDPADNIVQIANERGVPTRAAFFGKKVADDITATHGKADFVFARNVLPHVDKVDDVVAGMRQCLNVQGIGAVEFHYAKIIMDELHYDSIYHEHLFYFSIKSLSYLLQKHGLWIFDLIVSPISGGSLVIFFSQDKRAPSESLKKKIETEERSGLNTEAAWKGFSKQCLQHKVKLIAMIRDEVDKGLTVLGYGASARSSTLLNFCGINKEHLLCIADQNPLKHNRYTAGTDILILPPDAAFSKNPDVVLLLAWNFREEILSLLKNKYQFRGRIILPLPNDPKIIDFSNT